MRAARDPRGRSARLRRGAEEHVLPRQGRARVGGPSHRRPRRTTRRCARSATASSTSSACSRWSRRSSRTTCIPSTCPRSTRSSCDGVRAVGVQHHHAHLAACLAEHGESGPARRGDLRRHRVRQRRHGLGRRAALGDLAGVRARWAISVPVRMPGGEAAIREPWRMACAWLAAAYGTPQRAAAGRCGALVGPPRPGGRWPASRAAASPRPLTSSVGRLFDAVAALCGIRAEVNYEGQAAIELEAACDPDEPGAYPLELADDRGRSCSTPARRSARWPRTWGRRCRRGWPRRASTTRSPPRAHGRARRWPSVGGSRPWCCPAACSRTGGCSRQTARLVTAAGLRALVPERLPPNDGGISYGQAAVAAARLASEEDAR